MEEWKDWIDSWGFRHGPDLLTAAKNGDIAQAREAIKRGARLDFGLNSKALAMASMKGYTEIVKLLVENGADVNKKSDNGLTALMHASIGGYLEIVELLIKNGADINAKDILGETALMASSKKGYGNIMDMLIKNGADVNAKDDLGKTATVYASEKHSEDFKSMMMQHKYKK